MSFGFKFRDLLLSPKNKLSEVGIKPGFHILDYGCGPGSYSIAAAQLVGNSGKVYALDIHPLGIERVRDIASKKGIKNIETICSDCATGLEGGSIDVVLLYDTFHDLMDPDGVLKELHRILKTNSILSFSDHHMKEDEILSEITKNSLFKLSRKEKRSYIFLKS
jgi:ubiquinone/menaquinone biosynthesis C-methylase UbiE